MNLNISDDLILNLKNKLGIDYKCYLECIELIDPKFIVKNYFYPIKMNVENKVYVDLTEILLVSIESINKIIKDENDIKMQILKFRKLQKYMTPKFNLNYINFDAKIFFIKEKKLFKKTFYTKIIIEYEKNIFNNFYDFIKFILEKNEITYESEQIKNMRIEDFDDIESLLNIITYWRINLLQYVYHN